MLVKVVSLSPKSPCSLFHTHRRKLGKADVLSGVFRSASEACSDDRKRIEFTDIAIERAPVVRVYRGLLRHMTLPVVNTFEQCIVVCDTIAFLQNYECEGLLQLVKTECTNQLLLHTMPPLYALLVGAAMDDVELCVAALRHRYDVGEVPKGEARFIDSHILSLVALSTGSRRPLAAGSV